MRILCVSWGLALGLVACTGHQPQPPIFLHTLVPGPRLEAELPCLQASPCQDNPDEVCCRNPQEGTP